MRLQFAVFIDEDVTVAAAPAAAPLQAVVPAAPVEAKVIPAAITVSK